MTGPLKVAKFSQDFSSVKPWESESVQIWLMPLGNAAYVACLLLRSKWLNGKSI